MDKKYIVQVLQRTFKRLKKDARVLRAIKAIKNLQYSQSIIIYSCEYKRTRIKTMEGINVIVVGLKSSFIPNKYNIYNILGSMSKIKLTFLDKILRQLLYILYFLPLFKRKIKKVLKKEKPDIVYCNDFETLFAGVWYKKKYNRQLIYDSHEYWCESVKYTGYWKIFKLFIRIQEARYIKFCDKVITVSNEIAKALSNDYKIKKLYVIYNISTRRPKKIKKNAYLRNKFKLKKNDIIFIYIGHLMPDRGIEYICENVHLLPDNWKFIFMGYGWLSKYLIKKSRITNNKILYHPAVPPEKIISTITSANIGMYLFSKICKSHILTIGNKFWQYMQAGLPFISTNLISINNFFRSIYKIGEIMEDNNINSFIKAANKIIKNFDNYKKATKKATTQYTWDNEIKKLQKIINSL